MPELTPQDRQPGGSPDSFHGLSSISRYTLAMRFQCQSGCIRCCEQKGFVYVTKRRHCTACRSLGNHPRRIPAALPVRHRAAVALPQAAAQAMPISAAQRLFRACREAVAMQLLPFLAGAARPSLRRREAASYCPGMNRGPLVNLEMAGIIAEEVRRAFPELYDEESKG